jgi:hypothetical protein
LAFYQPEIPDTQKNRDHYRDSDKKVALPASTIRKKTECGTGVP